MTAGSLMLNNSVVGATSPLLNISVQPIAMTPKDKTLNGGSTDYGSMKMSDYKHREVKN